MFHNVELFFEDNYNVEPRVDLLRQRRFIRDYYNPIELPSTVFIANFQLSNDTFMYVLEKIKDKFYCSLSSSLTPMLILCCILKFFALGIYQQAVEY